MFKSTWTKVKLTAVLLYNYPVPVGNVVLVSGGLILLTALVSGKQKMIVHNHYGNGIL
jgi:hypothetical protein